MADLKYVIDADESQVIKSFKRIREESKNTTTQIEKDFQKIKQQDIKLEINRGDQATIPGGTVAGEHAKRGAAANEAFARSVQKATAEVRKSAEAIKQQGTATQAATASQKAQMASIERLTIKLQAYQRIAASTTDPSRLATYNKKIEETQARITQLSNIGKTGFDRFGNAIKNTESNLSKAGTTLRGIANLIPGIGLAGVISLAMGPLMDYITKLDLLGTKMREISAGAFTSPEYKEALKNVAEMESTIAGVAAKTITKEAALRQYNETIGQSQGKLKSYNELEKWMVENTDNYVKMIAMKAEAQAFLTVATDKATEAARRQAAGPTLTDYAKSAATNFFGGSGPFSIARIIADAEMNVLRDASSSKTGGNDALEIFKKKIKEAQEFAKKAGLNYFEPVTGKATGQSAIDARLEREKNLQNEIAKIRQDASRKLLEGEEAEKQGILDKYDQISKKVMDFFADPKNKGTKLKMGELMSDLLKAEETELTGVRNKYQNQDQQKAKEHLDELLKKYATFEDRRKTVMDESEKEIADLKAAGEYERAANAEAAAQERIEAIDKESAESLKAYKNLFDHIGTLSRKETLNRITDLRKELEYFTGSAEVKAKLLAELDRLEKGINDDEDKDSKDKNKKRIAEINEALNAIRDIATEFEHLNDELGAAANFLLNSAKAYVEIKNNLETLRNKDASGADRVAAGAGMVGAALGVINSIAGYLKGVKQANEMAKKAVADFHAAAIKGEREYQELLRKRDLDAAARGKSSYQAIVAQLELLKKQSPAIKKAYDKIYEALQSQSYLAGVGRINYKGFRKDKTFDIMASLLGSDYAKLEQLYGEGKLKDQAKADFEALRSLREELEAAGVSVQSLQDELQTLLTGTTAGGLADSLAQLFQNGKFAAQDLGDSFEEIMKNAIVNSFKYKVMEDAMKPFYDEFANLFINGTPSATEVDALKKKWEEAGAQLGDQFKELQNITGISLTKPGDTSGPSGNTISGAAAGIRADQADLLGARLGGIQITGIEALSQMKLQTGYNAQCVQLAMDNLNVALRIEQNTFRTADNTEALKDIRTGIISMEKKMSSTANALQGTGRGG